MIEPTKERIIAPWLLALLAALLALALYSMRPSQQFMAQSLAARAPSNLSVAYLKNWLRIDPQSPRLMALLAEQYLGLGHWQEARAIATQLTHLEGADYRQQGISLYLQTIERHAYEYPPGDARRHALTTQLNELINTLAGAENDVSTLAHLVKLARTMGTPETSWQLYERLAEKDSRHAAAWHSLQGQQALADGLYTQAAQAYFSAQTQSTTLADQRRSFLAALNALQAGNQVAQACDEADKHLGDLANDPETLRYLIVLARKGQRYDLMRRYGEALAKRLAFVPRYQDGLLGAQRLGWMPAPQLRLAASPANAASATPAPTPGDDLDLLYQAFVESQALSDAQDIARRALKRPGTDHRLWLSRLAQVSEWNNKPADALKAWQELAQTYHDAKAWDNVRRLAPQLGDSTLWVDALKQSLKADPEDAQQTGQLLAAYERSGNTKAARALLQQYPGMQGSTVSAEAVKHLEELAESAQAAGASTTLIPVIARLAQVDPDRAAHWHTQEGALALAAGHYEQAADAYFAAQAHSNGRDAQRTAFFAALNALRAGDKVAEACDQAQQHVGDLIQDRDTLRFLIGLAREGQRYDLMRQYGEALSKTLSMAPRYLDGLHGAVRLGWVATPHLMRVAAKADTTPAPKPESPAADDLDLLYQTFLESDALPDAIKTAQRALARSDVDRKLWLSRLAQAAEWNDQPKIALKAWQALAQKYDDADAWRELLRLAPQMDANEVWLEALRHEARRTPDNFQLTRQVVAAYERMGNPEGGLAFLRQQGSQDKRVLELRAELAQRSGHDDLALRAWQTLDQRYGPSPAYALHIATLLYAQGQLPQALAALQSARDAAQQQKPPAEFWRTYLSLARLLGQQDSQNHAIQALLEQGAADPADFDHFLYLYDGSPIDQARIAETAFRDTQDPNYLAQAITAYTQIRAWPRAQALLDGLSPAALQRAEQLPAFLDARAGLRQAANDPQGALDDLRRAYRMPNKGPDVDQSYLWALLSFGTRQEVRHVTNELAKRHGSQPEYASVLAGAMLQLDRPKRALAYMNAAGVPALQDPLWLLAYASVHQALGHPDLAWRIRRRAWQLLARKRASLKTLDAQAAEVSLAQTFRSGDASLGLLASLLRNAPPDGPRQAAAHSILGDVPGIPTLAQVTPSEAAPQTARDVDAARYAVVVAWAMEGGHGDLARAWLANRAVADLLKPASAQLALALQDNDQARIATLLEQDSVDLTGSDRTQALDRLGWLPAAQTEAFNALAGAPDNDHRYDEWLDEAMKQRPSAGLRVEYASLRPLETVSIFTDAGLTLTDHLGLKLRHTERFNHSMDKSELGWVPRRDEETSIALVHADVHHRYELELGRRDGLASQNTGLLSASWTPESRLRLDLQVGVNRYTDDDTWLALGGSKDFVGAALSWDSQRDWFASVDVQRARYKTQDGFRLGTGTGASATLGYHVRTEGPPIDLSAYVSHWGYSSRSALVYDFAPLMPDKQAPNAADIMPDNTSQYGLTLSLGSDQMTEYQRGWKPFLAVSLLHDSQRGWGPGVSAGIGGSLLGRDRLGFYITHEPASQGDSQQTTRVGLYYRFFY